MTIFNNAHQYLLSEWDKFEKIWEKNVALVDQNSPLKTLFCSNLFFTFNNRILPFNPNEDSFTKMVEILKSCNVLMESENQRADQ